MPTNGLKHPVMMQIMGALLRSVLLLSTLSALGQAQITLDGSLGPRGPLPGPNYRIDANVGQIRGSNLFHSFGQFNVRTDESASFAGPNTITNVVGRVTGGEPSSIDGRLRSEIAGANLYLLNPSGVMFGPNASLEVSGSFHVSTADFLRFADGAKFFANLGQESVLTVAPPAAFGFLGNNPAAITINGSSLTVSEGKALSAVGGDITIVGKGPLTADSAPTLGAPGGRIQLASVASPGEVVFSRLDLAPDLQVNSFTRLGRLELSQGAFLDASADGGGSVLLRSGRLRVDGSWIFADNNGPVHGAGLGMDLQVSADAAIANGAFLTTDSLGAGRARDLQLNVGSLTLTGGAQISSTSTRTVGSGDTGRLLVSTPLLTMDDSLLQTRADLNSHGNAGSIEVRAGRLMLSGGAQISSRTSGAGRGGDLTVVANDEIAIAGRNNQGQQSGLFSYTFGSRDAGRLFVSTPTLTMKDGSILAAASDRGSVGEISVDTGRVALTGGASIGSISSGTGRGGSVTVSARESVSIEGILSGITSYAAGDSGRVSLSAPTVTIDGGLVGSPGPELGGIFVFTAGNTSIQANDITLSGGARIRSDTFTDRNGGSISIETGRLTLSGGSQLVSGTRGSGHGGEVSVAAGEAISITGQDSGLFSNAFSLGDAGRLSISTPLLTMDRGLIQALAAAGSRGNAGSIEVRAGRLTLTGGAQIDTSTRSMGRGGDLTVTATDAISIAGRDSQGSRSGLFSQATGSGDAGRLSVSAPRLTITEGAQLLSDTRGSGRGGEATITASEAIRISGPGSGLFSNASSLGDAGQMVLSAPTLSLDDGALIQALAAAGSRGNAGSIEVRAGRLTLTGGAQIDTSTRSMGRGGDLTVTATDAISIAGRDSQGSRSGLFSQATGSGDAGRLSVSAPRLTITEGSQISSSSFGTGRGGNVTVAASEQLELSTGGTISASSSGKGDAGSIMIQAGKIFRSRNGAVTTEAEQADGGNIQLTVGSLVDLRDSQLAATVKSGVGKGGNIMIDPRFVILEGSQIRADAFGGPGGNIRIVSDVFLRDPASLVSASSALGIQGTVDIRAPVTSLSEAVAPLPQAFVSAAALLPARCAARLSGGRYSSLVVGGPEGLPLDPSGVLPSPLTLDGSVGDPAVDGTPHQQKTHTKFALLAVADKVFPRLHGGNLASGCSK